MMLFAVIVSSLANAAGAAPLIYATTYAGPHASILHSIQPATGAATAIGPIGFGQVGALAFAPDGSLYAVGKNGADKWVLLKIDLVSGRGTAAGPTGLDLPFHDIAFRADGKLFGYVRRSSANSKSGSVYLIDTTSGLASFTGNTEAASDDCAPVAISSDKALYSVGQRSLENIGATNSGPKIALHFSPSFGSAQVQASTVKFDAGSGMLWALMQTGGGASGNYLANIDLKTGNVSALGPTTEAFHGLAVLADLHPLNFAPLPSSLIFLLTGALALAAWNLRARYRRPARA